MTCIPYRLWRCGISGWKHHYSAIHLGYRRVFHLRLDQLLFLGHGWNPVHPSNLPRANRRFTGVKPPSFPEVARPCGHQQKFGLKMHLLSNFIRNWCRMEEVFEPTNLIWTETWPLSSWSAKIRLEIREIKGSTWLTLLQPTISGVTILYLQEPSYKTPWGLNWNPKFIVCCNEFEHFTVNALPYVWDLVCASYRARKQGKRNIIKKYLYKTLIYI